MHSLLAAPFFSMAMAIVVLATIAFVGYHARQRRIRRLPDGVRKNRGITVHPDGRRSGQFPDGSFIDD